MGPASPDPCSRSTDTPLHVGRPGAQEGLSLGASWWLEVRQLLLTQSKPAWQAGQGEADKEVLAVVHGSSPDQPRLEQFREGRDEPSDASVQGTVSPGGDGG